MRSQKSPGNFQRIHIGDMLTFGHKIGIRLAVGTRKIKRFRTPKQIENTFTITNFGMREILMEAAPAIQRSRRNTCFCRIVVYVSDATEQLFVVRNDHTLESFLEHRSTATGFLIEVFRICRINRMHSNAHLIIEIIK